MIQLVFEAGDAAEALADRRRCRSATARTRAPRARRLGRGQARARRRRPSGRVSGRRLAREQVHRGARTSVARRRRASAATTRAARTSSPRSHVEDDPERSAGGACRRFRGSSSRAAGASCRRRSSTGRRARTSSASGRSRSRGRRAGGTRSYAVPTGGLFGTGATDFFCSAVAKGSQGLIHLLRSPGLTLAHARRLLLALVALRDHAHDLAPGRPLRTGPPAELRVRSSRASGTDVRAARAAVPRDRAHRRSRSRSSSPSCTRCSSAVLGVAGYRRHRRGRPAALVLLVVAIGTDADPRRARARAGCRRTRARRDRCGPRDRAGSRRTAASFDSCVHCSAASASPRSPWVALSATGVLAPVAIWLAVRWSLLAQAVELEERVAIARSGGARSSCAAGGCERRALVGVGAALALVAGPLVGALLIFATDAPLALLNVVAGVVYALAMPFVALVSSYLYFDARVREQLAPAVEPSELPAEIELST